MLPSDSLLQKNAKLLEKQPLKSCVIPRGLFPKIQSEIYPCKQEGFYLQNSFGSLNSKINSLHEAKKTIQAQTKNWSSRYYVVLGLELGYHTLEILNSSPNSTVWVLETSLETITAACSVQDFTPYLEQKQLFIFHIQQSQGLESLIVQIPHILVNIFIHRASYEQNKTLYEAIKSVIDSILEMKKVNINTIDHFQKLWIPHILKNIPQYMEYEGVDKLRSWFQGNSCIIVAAGPSLEKNIQELKMINRKNIIIIAVNTVIPRLLHEKIIPDLIVAIDPQNLLFYSFIPLLMLSKAPLLIAEPSLFPSIIHNYPGPIIFSGTPLFKELLHPPIPDKHRLDVGGSVATVAYSLSVYLGAKEIIFLGLDLAYSANRMHLRGNEQDTLYLFQQSSRFNTWEIFNHKKSLSPHKTLQHDGFFGNKVSIDTKFKTYIDWLENRFGYYQKNFPTFNATEGGIAFTQVPNVVFRSLFSHFHKNVPPLSPLTEKIQSFQHLQKIVNKLEKLFDFFQQCRQNLQDWLHHPSSTSLQDRLPKLLESEWITTKTQKFFFEIENYPENFLSEQELSSPKQKEKAIQQKTAQILLEKTEENLKIIQKIILYLNVVRTKIYAPTPDK